ncbi:MAG: hypothetical protein IJI36_07920 [Kiritimatiellae bacterium]|nr:hypothetical protein [Kiritimatiellia bacterium]
MSVVSAQSGITAREGKPFAFYTNGSEFFPAAGARLRFASCDTDTLTLPGLPVGLIGKNDVVTVSYKGTQVFRGTVSTRVERQGRGTDRVEDVTVEGPWGVMSRLVFRQQWMVSGVGGTMGESSSHVVLNQSPLGQPQNMSAQVKEIADYAAGFSDCGFTVGAIDAGTQQLPPDDARDLTCTAAIMRTLRFFPQTVCRFDYASGAAFTVSMPPASPSPASYLATILKTQRSYTRTAHPVVGVDIATESFDLVTGNNAADAALRKFTHQTAGDTDSVDTLHIFMPLEKGSSSTSWEKLEVETLDRRTDGVYTSINFWIRNHPELKGLTYSAGNTNGISAFGPITPNPLPYPNLTDTTVGDLKRFGLNAEVVRLTCPVTITTPEKEEHLVLTLDYVCTNATSRTYTRQTGSSSTAGETLPGGLAAAILAQRGGELMAEEVTIRLGDSFPTLGDADVVDGETVYLQSFDVDCYDLTAQLHFGRPPYLSPEDMRDLLLGFRQRGFASNVPNRGEPDADDNMDDVGGVQPICSSSTTIASIAKATVKGSGNAGNKITLDTTSSKAAIKIEKTSSGTVNLDSEDVGSGKEAKFRDLKYTDSNGTEQTIKVLATEAATIPPGGSAPSGTPVDVLVGISSATFNSNSHQLEVKFARKKAYVLSVDPTDPSDLTLQLPLYENDVVVGSDYNVTDQHVFNNFTRKGVITGSDSQSTPDPVFTSTAHSAE